MWSERSAKGRVRRALEVVSEMVGQKEIDVLLGLKPKVCEDWNGPAEAVPLQAALMRLALARADRFPSAVDVIKAFGARLS